MPTPEPCAEPPTTVTVPLGLLSAVLEMFTREPIVVTEDDHRAAHHLFRLRDRAIDGRDPGQDLREAARALVTDMQDVEDDLHPETGEELESVRAMRQALERAEKDAIDGGGEGGQASSPPLRPVPVHPTRPAAVLEALTGLDNPSYHTGRAAAYHTAATLLQRVLEARPAPMAVPRVSVERLVRDLERAELDAESSATASATR